VYALCGCGPFQQESLAHGIKRVARPALSAAVAFLACVMPSILFLSTWMICSQEKKKSNFTNMLKVLRIRNVPSFFLLSPPCAHTRSPFSHAWHKKKIFHQTMRLFKRESRSNWLEIAEGNWLLHSLLARQKIISFG
jgi:hypothetical protein